VEQSEDNQGNAMSGPAKSTASFREKAFGQFKEMAALALYLYVCLGAVVLLKAAILQDVGVHFAIWGIAAVKALLLAKFMLLGREFQIGRKFRDRPLILPILYHALIFLVLLLVLSTIEELVVGSIRHRPLSDSLAHIVGPTVFEGLAVCLVLFLILIPYSAYDCLEDVLGEREAFRLFFVDGARAITVRSPRTAH
jgi:hypothetical protein